MANINLTTTEKTEVSETAISGGIVLAVILIVLILIVYGTLYFWKKDLTDKTKAMQTQYNTDLESFKKGDSKIVLDFRNRLDIAKSLIVERNIPVLTFSELENRIIAGVSINSYSYDSTKNQIVVTCVADSFKIVAEQIANFKKDSVYFGGITTGETKYNQNGKIEIPIGVEIK